MATFNKHLITTTSVPFMTTSTSAYVFNGLKNSSGSNNVDATKYELVMPDMVLWIYVIIICLFGILLNCVIVTSLLRSKCNGRSLK